MKECSALLTIIVGVISILLAIAFWFGQPINFNPWSAIFCGMSAIELGIREFQAKK